MDGLQGWIIPVILAFREGLLWLISRMVNSYMDWFMSLLGFQHVSVCDFLRF